MALTGIKCLSIRRTGEVTLDEPGALLLIHGCDVPAVTCKTLQTSHLRKRNCLTMGMLATFADFRTSVQTPIQVRLNP